MAVSEYAFALCALLGTLLVPFLALYQVIRVKRRAIRATVLATSRGARR